VNLSYFRWVAFCVKLFGHFQISSILAYLKHLYKPLIVVSLAHYYEDHIAFYGDLQAYLKINRFLFHVEN